MKIIDLYNKIANGEEVPKQIRYCGVDYYWTNSTYENPEAEETLFWFDVYSEEHLNDEIEIIEDKEMCHKCGKYPAEYNQTYCEFCLGILEEDKKIEKFKDYIPIGLTSAGADFSKKDVFEALLKIGDKINEIIDYINKERE